VKLSKATGEANSAFGSTNGGASDSAGKMAMPMTSKSPIAIKQINSTALPKSPPPLRFPHPGEILQAEFLEPMEVTRYRLAVDLKIPHSRVTAIICGRRSITPDTALHLSRYFGTSAEFWIGLQQEFDLCKARAESGAEIESQVMPLTV
jgi:addiction module HigA family antidote